VTYVPPSLRTRIRNYITLTVSGGCGLAQRAAGATLELITYSDGCVSVVCPSFCCMVMCEWYQNYTSDLNIFVLCSACWFRANRHRSSHIYVRTHSLDSSSRSREWSMCAITKENARKGRMFLRSMGIN